MIVLINDIRENNEHNVNDNNNSGEDNDNDVNNDNYDGGDNDKANSKALVTSFHLFPEATHI